MRTDYTSSSIDHLNTNYITGAMKTTASSVLDVLAGLLPIHLAVDKWRHNAAITLATVPEKHPIYNLMKRAAMSKVTQARYTKFSTPTA